MLAGGVWVGEPIVDWDQVRRWRKDQRAILLERRVAISSDDRKHWSERITASILLQVRTRRPALVGLYWPFKGEYDPRGIARLLHADGTSLALPVVMQKAAPVIFREWHPGACLVPGVWNIPVPADGEAVLPDLLLVPLVGYDQQGFRLGYGGGYYDRTLAAMPHRPMTLGVGFALASLPTIHPQPHDIPMDAIITEQEAAIMVPGPRSGQPIL